MSIGRKVIVRLLTVAAMPLVLLVIRWEFGIRLVHRGMPKWQVVVLMGEPDFLDTLPECPAEEGYGAFYAPAFFRPMLAVELGQDGRVRDIHYYYP
jgi:hypothetical protein